MIIAGGTMGVHLTNQIFFSGNLEMEQEVVNQLCWMSGHRNNMGHHLYSELREAKRKGSGRDPVAKERLRPSLPHPPY